MNLAVLIGNGFDLNLGLDTSYNSFIKWYKTLNFNNKLIKDFVNKLDLWSDLETQLGKITSNFGNNIESVNDYKKCYAHMIRNLNKYMVFQDARLRIEEMYKVSDFVAPFIDFQKDKVFNETESALLGDFSRSNINYINFLTFNYTNTIEKLFFDRSSFQTNSLYNNKNVDILSCNVFHIHGDLKNNMILGVNDTSQISNLFFKDTKLLNNYLIKSETMKHIKSNKFEIFTSLIERANLIMCYGLSFGETDKRYWKQLIDQMVKDPSLKIVCFVKVNENEIEPFALYLESSENIIHANKQKLLRYYDGEDEKMIKSLNDRIIISSKVDLFKKSNICVDK